MGTHLLHLSNLRKNTFNVGDEFIPELNDAVMNKEKKPNSKYHYDLILENYLINNSLTTRKYVL